jgi:hypothetical protein
MTNEVAVRRTQICLCCGASWESNHSRGPLLCGLCFQSLGLMIGGQLRSVCKAHMREVSANEVCPPATMTNGPYVPLVAR